MQTFIKKSVTIPADLLDRIQNVYNVHYYTGFTLSRMVQSAMRGMIEPGPMSFTPYRNAGGLYGIIVEHGDLIGSYLPSPDGWRLEQLVPRLVFLNRFSLHRDTWIASKSNGTH